MPESKQPYRRNRCRSLGSAKRSCWKLSFEEIMIGKMVVKPVFVVNIQNRSYKINRLYIYIHLI